MQGDVKKGKYVRQNYVESRFGIFDIFDFAMVTAKTLCRIGILRAKN